MVVTYDSIADLAAEKERHKKAFDEAVEAQLEKQKGSGTLLTKETFDKIVEACKKKKTLDKAAFKDLSTQEGYTQAYKWVKKYDCITLEDKDVLIFMQEEGAALEDAIQVSHSGRVFEDFHAIHTENNDHPKARTFKNRVVSKFGKSIPVWLQKIFTDTCPRCIEKARRTKPTAGHQPIITKGFGVRGQVDLIDFQSMPDGPFNFLMTYQDHGIKICHLTPIVRKRASCVAYALLEIFTLLGPPAILQSDNGREFSNAATASGGRFVELDDEVRHCCVHLLTS